MKKTITIGGMSKEKYLAAFKKADIDVSDYAKDLMSKVEYQKKIQKLEIEIISVADLGFTTWTTRDAIYARAKEKGYDIILAEVGFALRLAYADQPLNDWIYMGMEPITVSDGDPSVFYLERVGDGLWLDSYWAEPGYEWDPDDEFAFRLRKYSSSETETPTSSSDPLILKRLDALEKRMDKLKEI